MRLHISGVNNNIVPGCCCVGQYAEDPALVEAMHEWRNILDQFTSGLEHKVMMVPVALLDSLAAASFPHLGHLLHQLDLIHVPVNLTSSAKVCQNTF